jgi:hypothetical protein
VAVTEKRALDTRVYSLGSRDHSVDAELVTASEPPLMSTLPLELFEIDGESSANGDYRKGGIP